MVNSIKRICTMYNEDYCNEPNFIPAQWELVQEWNFSDQCTLASKSVIDGYFNDVRFFDELEFMLNAKENIDKLSDYYNIIIVSLGNTNNLLIKETFLNNNLQVPHLFIGCNFNDSDDKRHVDMSNGVFVDDISKNLTTCNSNYKILFGRTYKWNYDWTGMHVLNWDDLYQLLLQIYQFENSNKTQLNSTKEKNMDNKLVYIGGDMLEVGSQMLRAKERDEVKSLGFSCYTPQDNEDINDKANLDNNDGLAEKIVDKDTRGIRESDIIILEPTVHACGTMVELGQVKGMKDIAKDIIHILNSEDDDSIAIGKIASLAYKILNKTVFTHYEDVRRFKGCIESEDRRAFGVNQYVYGVSLDLTDGKGFYEWDEILDELKKINKEGQDGRK